MTVSQAQTFINQIYQEGYTPISAFEEDPFWDSLVPNSESTENEEVKNNIPPVTQAGQGIFDNFDIQEFKSHIKG